MKNKSATTKDINNDLTEKVNINCLTLDELCFDFDKVDFIKIDCDGADADIILSGKSTISTKKPIILFEDMGLDYDFNSDIFLAYKDAYSFLINHEYHLFKVEDRSFVRTSNQQIKNQYANIIALPQ
jgi:hypothetical protein